MANLDFSYKDQATLHKLVNWYRVKEGGTPQQAQAHKPGNNTFNRIVKTPTGGIPAFSGNDPGSAECDLCRLDENLELIVINAGASTLTIKNSSTSSVAGGAFVVVHKDPWGAWWVGGGGGGGDGGGTGFVTATLDQDVTELTEINAIDHAMPFAHATSITGTIVDGYQGASEKPATGVRTGKIRLINPSRFYGAQNTPFTATDSGVNSGSITSSGVTEGVNYFVIQSMACNELSEACAHGGGFTPV